MIEFFVWFGIVWCLPGLICGSILSYWDFKKEITPNCTITYVICAFCSSITCGWFVCAMCLDDYMQSKNNKPKGLQ